MRSVVALIAYLKENKTGKACRLFFESFSVWLKRLRWRLSRKKMHRQVARVHWIVWACGRFFGSLISLVTFHPRDILAAAGRFISLCMLGPLSIDLVAPHFTQKREERHKYNNNLGQTTTRTTTLAKQQPGQQPWPTTRTTTLVNNPDNNPDNNPGQQHWPTTLANNTGQQDWPTRHKRTCKRILLSGSHPMGQRIGDETECQQSKADDRLGVGVMK